MASLKYKTENGYESLPAQVVTKTNAENGNGIGTCSTSSGTALIVSLTGYELVQNGFVAVTFENDVPANATLNVNNKGAKPIIYKGTAIEAGVIKADDTVTFGYDGTNYVVTSLGGGGGSVVFPEFVTIQLTQSGGSDSDLIGATVVVTNDDTSETILSTTWQGSDIAVSINEGINYTVAVGNITDYASKQTHQSYTAIALERRTIIFVYIAYMVDLGLPSRTLWARGNIIKDGTTYKIGSETDYGAYISWGNIVPHFSTNRTSFDDGYLFTLSAYNSTPGHSLTASIAQDGGYDICRQLLGAPYRLPSKDDFQELKDYTTTSKITKDGVVVLEVVSTINGAKIFLPAAGSSNSDTGALGYQGYGYYHTSSISNSGTNSSWRIAFTGNSFGVGETDRHMGHSVRPVI